MKFYVEVNDHCSIVEAYNRQQAIKIARENFTPDVKARPATEEDLAWVYGMGGGA